MANVTVSSDANFTDALFSSFTDGDDITIEDGATLTINTDTRDSASDAVIGTVTIEEVTGGKLKIDGTTVRLLGYDGGSGSAPAVGNTVTGGTSGASGEIIWVNGDATSGTIKLRSVTSGPFQDNEALTGSGFVANADGADRVGWIEIILGENEDNTCPRLGEFDFDGEWYELGTTDGVQATEYNNYVPNSFPGVWVETGTGTAAYEFFPAVSNHTNPNIGTPNDLAKLCGVKDDGTFSFGNNYYLGSKTDCGAYVPPSGRKIRVPNVQLSIASSADWNGYELPSSINDFAQLKSSGNGVTNYDTVQFSGIFSTGSPYSVEMINCSFIQVLTILPSVDGISLTNIGIGAAWTEWGTGLYVYLSNGDTIDGFVASYDADAYSTADSEKYRFYGEGASVSNVKVLCADQSNYQQRRMLFSANGDNMTYSNIEVYGGQLYVTATDSSVSNIIQSNTIGGAFTTSQGSDGVYLKGALGTTLDSVSLPTVGGSLPFYNYIRVYTDPIVEKPTTIRNIGLPSAYLDLNNQCVTGVMHEAGKARTERCYFTDPYNNIYEEIRVEGSASEGYLQNIGQDYVTPITPRGDNMEWKGVQGGSGAFGASTGIATTHESVFGTHFYNVFSSDTDAKIGIFFNEKSSVEPSSSAYEVTSGTPVFTSAGDLLMRTSGDQIEYEWTYNILGIDSLDNTAVTLSGTNTGNIDYKYKIDTGSGYGGSWQTLNGTNLSAESIDYQDGFKLKIQLTCNTTNASNLLDGLYIEGTTTLAHQRVLYPIDLVTLEVTNVVDGSTVRIEKQSDGSLVVDGFAGPDGVFSKQVAYTEDILVDVVIRKSSTSPKQRPYRAQADLTSSGLSIIASQEVDTTAS